MGMINITCPVCKQVHEWFSGNLDRRCFRCKWSAANTAPEKILPGTIKDESSIWDGNRWHQIAPRRAVEGDIGDWNECQAYKFAHGALNAESALLGALSWKDRAFKAESEARMNRRISESYMKSRKRWITKARELAKSLENCEDFIELLQGRLTRIREDAKLDP